MVYQNFFFRYIHLLKLNPVIYIYIHVLYKGIGMYQAEKKIHFVSQNFKSASIFIFWFLIQESWSIERINCLQSFRWMLLNWTFFCWNIFLFLLFHPLYFATLLIFVFGEEKFWFLLFQCSFFGLFKFNLCYFIWEFSCYSE